MLAGLRRRPRPGRNSVDLNSWTPTDKARRLAILVAVYFAVCMHIVFWAVLGWPWYGSLAAAVGCYFALFQPLFAFLRKRFRG